jgi:two-component system, OmpR family, phosphate regulon sensor histidine kinase PhoR
VKVKITDTGVGIAKEKIIHVFEPFYKADESRSTGSGVGLGLAIVKEIVAKHKGLIDIESELDKGTTVLITLPSYAEDAS